MGLWIWRLLTACWAMVIWSLSSSPFRSERSKSVLEEWLEQLLGAPVSPDVADAINVTIRKTAHVVEFAILAALVLLALGGRARWWAMGLAMAFGLVDEIHQIWVPGRGASLIDSLFDAAGAVVGVLILARYSGGSSSCRG